jgi:glycosyltransferase involved in cell wall biosynthesis
MKILYLSRGHTPHDHRFLSAMVEGGHTPFFLPETAVKTEDRPLPSGVTAASGDLKQAIRESKPDLIHAGPLHQASYAAARTGIHPLVQMSWGSDILWRAKRNLLTRRRVRYSLQQADAVIGDCAAVKNEVMRFDISEQKIVTFPWGIDLERFRPGVNVELRAQLGWQNTFVILHLRSLEPLYDPLTVAHAFVAAARKNSALRLLMPGTGTLFDKVKAVFAKADLFNRVSMPGQISQDDLPSYYHAADLYLSASLSDGSSVSLMEALASGLPVAVTDIPSNREWVGEEKQGWLFAAKGHQAISKLILQAADSKLDDMRTSARQTAEEKADWSRNKLQLFRAYEIALEAR